jgi:hypothetical protein
LAQWTLVFRFQAWLSRPFIPQLCNPAMTAQFVAVFETNPKSNSVTLKL